ncbi:DUF5946 family protein [Saccharothrix sp.]|uniref:DUF5946 family protein n=1 Tax=Saccharothrix sp. TaxID=1873460 RepID=UPI0028122C7A|nr:DUF5946 family protein [Saccharothrix sp.]
MSCPECGTTEPCEELFHAVLALDHSRRPPWGPLHGVTVACYLLQHPSRLPEGHRGPPRELLRAYVDGGLRAVTALTGARRRANRGRGPSHVSTALGPPPTGFAVTIGDVAAGGTFPAEGFADRVRAWAAATAAAWDGR